MKNARSIVKVLGTLFVMLGVIILMCTPLSIIDEDGSLAGFLYSGIGVIVIGALLFGSSYNYPSRITKHEGYLIVGVTWVGMAIVGSIPYLLTLDISITDAFFESISGLTTTGATIFNDIESMPRSILLWRSLTQWLGGMGIIVLTVALLPLLGVGGVELFTAEAPGPTSNKIHPRIRETAKRLWLIYLGLTVVLGFLLWASGMSSFDALNHALTTMATGGFSTKNASIAHFESAQIEYIITLFMLFAGINYTVLFFLFTGRWRRVINNEEWRAYLTFVVFFCLIICSILFFREGWALENSLRTGMFQVISLITTTGYVTSDYAQWGSGVPIIVFLLLFLGASAGSTSGGIKIIRHLVFIKNSYFEFNRLIHPKAVIRIKINGEVVKPRILTHILVFLLIYIFIFILGTMALSFMGLDFVTALGAAATSIGNVGPGLGMVGPAYTFAGLSDGIKGVLSVMMLLGRLELFSILILFTPYYWRSL